MLDPMCVYKTPCGWCSKFDKECDNKIPETKPAVSVSTKVCTDKNGTKGVNWLSQNQIEAIFTERKR